MTPEARAREKAPWSEVAATAAALAVVASFVGGPVTASWVLTFLPDLPDAYAVPSGLRRKLDLPGPPAAYWLTWAAPPMIVVVLIGVGAAVRRRWRWVLVGCAVAFFISYTPLAAFYISIELGGFAPT